jgi:putative transposase
MTNFPRWLCHLRQLVGMVLTLLVDALRYAGLCLRSPAALAAANLFIRKQLALYGERNVKPRRATRATRIALVWLGRGFDWRQGLTVVQLDGHQSRLTCQRSSVAWLVTTRRGARSGSPTNCSSSVACACHHARCGSICPSTWTTDGIDASPPQRWLTFVRHHAQAIVAGDFCVVVTATFKMLYMFVVMEHATRRILHTNVTAHPTAQWTIPQLRDAMPVDPGYRFLIHDRDSLFSAELDQHMRHPGLRVLKTPVRSPQANSLCERLLGTVRRECLAFLIPLTEHHLRRLLKEWGQHYNAGRPHMALGPGIPQPSPGLPVPLHGHRHCIPEHLQVVARPILGGLHREYGLEDNAA